MHVPMNNMLINPDDDSSVYSTDHSEEELFAIDFGGVASELAQPYDLNANLLSMEELMNNPLMNFQPTPVPSTLMSHPIVPIVEDVKPIVKKPAKPVSTATLKRKASELSNAASVAETKKTTTKRKRTQRLSPEEKARRKLERQIARRQRKSIREKERRNNVNQLFEQMAKILGVPKENSDRRSILSKAIETFQKYGVCNQDTETPTTTTTKTNNKIQSAVAAN